MATATLTQPAQQIVSRKSWLTLALSTLALFAAFLDTTVLFVAFPSIRRSCPSDSDAELSWVLDAYNIIFAALLVPGGRLADQFGRKRLYLIGVAILTGASVVCGVSGTPAMLIACRAIQAAGGTLLLPSSLALVLHSFPKSKRAIAVTTWGAVGGLAAATGPSLGGSIIQAWGWPWAFFLNLPVGWWHFLRKGASGRLNERVCATPAGRCRDRRFPAWLGRLLAGEAIAALMTIIRGSSNEKAKRLLNWQPRYASWRHGFRNGLA